MKYLNNIEMRNLSFPDFEIQKMKLFIETRALEIFIEGAWWDAGEGLALGKGVLFFTNWENLLIRKFNPITETWSELTECESSTEFLRDLCEVKFTDSTVSLFGFGKNSGQWIEWKIVNAEMHAEFIDQIRA